MARKRLADVHIRLDESVYSYAKKVADEYGLSLAEVIRKALGNSLEEYATNIRYIDKDQGDAIRNIVMSIFEKIDHMDREISGIGNNVNQLAHMKNINRKIYKEKSKQVPDQELIALYRKQMAEIEYQANKGIDVDKIAELNNEYKEASSSLCKNLWRIIQ